MRVQALDARLFRYLARELPAASDPERVWIGVGTWLYAKRPEGAVAQLRALRAAGARGDSLFSWDAIADAPALRAALVAEATATLEPAATTAPSPAATTAVESAGEAAPAPPAVPATEGPGAP